MIIGTFKKQAEGYAGNLITLTHRGKLVFAPAPRGADYQVTFVLADKSRATLSKVWPNPVDPSALRAIVATGVQFDGLLQRRAM